MPRLVHRHPKYRPHRPSGQARVTLNGKDFYLGPWKSEASHANYDRLIAEWIANGRSLHRLEKGSTDLTVVELFDRFLIHAKGEYMRSDGSMSTEFGLYKDAIRIANALYADSLAAGFTPLSLRACQSKMIEKGWTRGTVNKAVSRLKHIWGWAVGEQLIDPMVHHGLCCVRGLKPGRSEARESEPVRPVDDAIVEATLPYCSPPVKAMVQLQRLTGARPGEICQMRIGDIDRSGKEWIYKPRRHKNTHRGQDRSIYIGPKGQEILGPFLLKLNPEAFCFSPIEADRQRREEKHARRKTPLNAGNSPGTNVRKKPKWQPRDHYDTGTYNKSVRRACLKAFPPPPPLGRNPGETWEEWRTRIKASPELTEELAKWQKEHCWHVHQLRHSAATQAKQEFDLDAARAMLGHKHINMTERYVDADSTLARKVAAKIG